MRPTPPDLPIPSRSTETLLEDLDIALRKVALQYHPSNVDSVCRIHDELQQRAVKLGRPLRSLSKATGWMMDDLLQQCLSGGEEYPRVRLLNGLRRDQVCYGCKKRERPEDPTTFLVCDECLKAMLRAVETKRPAAGMFLYRTYTPEARCRHANDETVLVLYPWFEAEAGVCATCLREAIAERSAS
jgi:hypothetical protein